MTTPISTTSSSPVFDPTDLKYQADVKFSPDKEGIWEHAKECDGWVHAHNAIRGELQTIQDCLLAMQGRRSDQWEITSLQTIMKVHVDHVHEHHTNEDKYMTPALLKRAKYPDKLTHDHDGIEKRSIGIGTLVASLKAGGIDNGSILTNLLDAWKEYRTDLEDHFKEEEAIGLPLMRAYFTPKEIAVITKLFLQAQQELILGSFVYHMGAERFRSEFMKQEGIPFFVWYIEFGSARKAYIATVVANTEALKQGVEPVPKSSGLLGC